MSPLAPRDDRPSGPQLGAVFVLSASVIALELALMRCFAIARWHNFSYLVISTALLGFGASGTLLTFTGAWLRRHFSSAAPLLTVLFALSVSVTFRAAEALPFDPRYVLYSARHALLMGGHHLLLFVPFLLAATVIGLSLSRFGGHVHVVYAANMMGSGAGAALALGLMYVLPAQRLLHVVAGLGCFAALLWAWRSKHRWVAAMACVCGILIACEAVLRPLPLRVDAYKDLGQMELHAAEGKARRTLARRSPRGFLAVYESNVLHRTMFASLTGHELPPAQSAMLMDGDLHAVVFRISSADDAAILDCTPMSLAYRLVPDARVLLLGEAGGTNVWLARRMGAAHITVVQPNPQIIGVMRGPLAGEGGGVFSGADVTVVASDPRAYVEGCRERYDVIQLVTAEGMPAATSGMLSLHEDFLLTREGLARCMERLTERGILTVTRGTQSPPRDNVKVFATVYDALTSVGVTRPGDQLLQARNWVAATTLAFASPITSAQCEALRHARRALNLDVEWAPCADLLSVEQLHHADGPDTSRTWLRYAAEEIAGGHGERFIGAWVYDVRPATDDRPYFHSFFRWRSLPQFIRAYGSRWMTRLELGYVVLVFALVQAVVVGAVLILLPLVRLRGGAGASGRLPVLTYFVLLGLAYLMLEMVCILKFTRFLGDPLYAAAGVLSSFMVFSGLGSALSRRLCRSPRRAAMLGGIGAACLAAAYVVVPEAVFRALAGWPLAGRLAMSVGLTAPVAFLMGWPFPNGLTLVEENAPALVPWAWGANGFASVAASPLAVIIAIGWGYGAVLILCAGLYAAAALAAFRLGLRKDRPSNARPILDG